MEPVFQSLHPVIVVLLDLDDARASARGVTEGDIDSRRHTAGVHSNVSDGLAQRPGNSDEEGLAHSWP